MAEVIGVLAGGAGLASLAFQLIEGSVKIKRFCHAYKDAPDRLKGISEELETFALALKMLDRDCQQYSDLDRATVGRCIQICDRAVTAVSAAVDRLEVAVQRSNFKGRVCSALGQGSISQLCDDLERAKSSLVFAHGLYSAECRKKDASQILERLEDLRLMQERALLFPFPDEERSSLTAVRQSNELEHAAKSAGFEIIQRTQRTTCQTKGRRNSSKIRRIRFSAWFTNRVWEISFAAAQMGFDFTLRTCNIVTGDALIFDVCRGGSISEVQALFESGEASPYDCSTHGFTPLSEAALGGNVQVCQYLVKEAGFPLSPNGPFDALDLYAMHCFTIKKERDHPEAVEMYRLLLNQPGLDADILVKGNSHCYWWANCPDATCVRLLRDEFSFAFSELSWEAQVTLAVECWVNIKRERPEIFLAMLGYNVVNSRVAQACDKSGCTALHMIARKLPSQMVVQDVPLSWIDFVQHLLRCGANLHQENDKGESPFITLLRNEDCWDVPYAVKFWTRLLQAAGIDLITYGRNEMTRWNKSDSTYTSKRKCLVTAWTYGANADDWTVEFRHKHSDPVVKIPVYEMVDAPGTWPEVDEFKIRTICWEPEEEDVSEGSWRWSKVRNVIFPRTDRSQMFSSGNGLGFDLEQDLLGAQDDCRVVVRLLQASSRPCGRPRSCSQPNRSISRRVDSSDMWLPGCHVCFGNNGFRLAVGGSVYSSRRRCAKGIHEVYTRDDCCTNIKRKMRLFQLRYRNVDELRALPYAAYHPVWRRDV